MPTPPVTTNVPVVVLDDEIFAPSKVLPAAIHNE